MNDSTSRKSGNRKSGNQRRVGLFLLMVVVGAIAGYLVYWNRHGDQGPALARRDAEPGAQATALSADEVRQILELKDVSIGHLENGPAKIQTEGGNVSGLDVAADGFETLAQKVPRERLPLQNLAITRLLLLQNAQDDLVARRGQARADVQRLLTVDPISAAAYWIAAAVELHPDAADAAGASDEARQKAITLLQRATELEPDNAVFWFALSRAATKPGEAASSELTKTALGKAYAANPRNIYLLTEWLMMQAKVKDPALIETLAAAQAVVAPLTTAVKRPGVDIGKFLADATAAVEAGEWRMAESRVRVIQNVVRPEEIAKSDMTRVDIHPLEFVLYDFSSQFASADKLPTPAWSTTTPVKLTSTDVGLPALTDVQDLWAVDANLNGLVDIIVLQPGKLSIWGPSKLGEPWSEIASLEVPAGMHRILAADLDRDRRKAPSAPAPAAEADAPDAQFDRVLSETAICHDADPDIIVYGEAGVLVIRNDTEAEAGEPKLVVIANEGLQNLTGVTAGLLVDVEHDADLDLVFSSQQGVTIWEAGGKLQYTDISAYSVMPPADVAITTMVAVDWDRDADIDVVIAEPTGKVVGLLENQRHAEFRWVPLAADYEALGKPQALALVEADGNVSWDLVSAGEGGVHVAFTATPRSGLVNYVRTQQLAEQAASGALVWDFDNDGFRDVVAWGSTGLTTFRGGPQGQFQAVELIEGALSSAIPAVRCADLDRDGDQDLVVATSEGVVILINQGGSNNNWLTLFPMGQEDNKGRCNHDAIGSLVELRSGGWYQAQVVETPTVHFGLGDRKMAEQLRIVWTNGVPQDLVELKGNVAICERMALKGSCPFIYTLANGKFSFFSDCLWAAPLGLQTSEGGVAPTRAWEYLQIPGDRLTPHEGSYWIQVTEELWEAGYFDKIQLIAVDHPAEVEVYTNEKVGPPDIAEFKMHPVRKRRFPQSAVDQRGTDLRESLRACDGQFVKAFDQRIRQGLAPEHYIELDLGDLGSPQQVTLFLTGWIFPTDTSLNIAFLQDPEVDGPRMPGVWVPDKDGQWKETMAFMGFPGGKTKTIAVDLTHAFLTQDYRVRIQTTAEIYWDEVFYSVDEPAAEIRQLPLELVSADLAFRGFSAPHPTPENAPQMYDADIVSHSPIWPPMRGRFTRYGSVRELLTEGDDMMAVLGAGDAITIRFAVPDVPVPAGWKRDFILHSIGWDKDADLNTIYGQSVEPLPFRGMQSYPFGPDERVPESAAYRDYLRVYQTREQDPQRFWRHLKLQGPS
ncbi:MAG: FG-GAP-like repeat-containing protein [Pirellulaceae bacterium]